MNKRLRVFIYLVFVRLRSMCVNIAWFFPGIYKMLCKIFFAAHKIKFGYGWHFGLIALSGKINTAYVFNVALSLNGFHHRQIFFCLSQTFILPISWAFLLVSIKGIDTKNKRTWLFFLNNRKRSQVKRMAT